jgi:hypothetical protein
MITLASPERTFRSGASPFTRRTNHNRAFAIAMTTGDVRPVKFARCYRMALFLLAWPWVRPRRRMRKTEHKTLRLVELAGSRGTTGKVNFLERYSHAIRGQSGLYEKTVQQYFRLTKYMQAHVHMNWNMKLIRSIEYFRAPKLSFQTIDNRAYTLAGRENAGSIRHMSRLVLGTKQLATESPFLGVKRKRRQADRLHLPPRLRRAELHLHFLVLMAWSLIKLERRSNFL